MIIENNQKAVELIFGRRAQRDTRRAAVVQTLIELLPAKIELHCFSPHKAMIPSLGVEKFYMDIYPTDDTCCYNEQGEWDVDLWEASVVGSVVFDSEKQFKEVMLPAIKELVERGVWGRFEVRYLDGRTRMGARTVILA